MFSFRRKIEKQDEEHASLPLAPMADVFMVVLIFLLKCFSYDLSAVAANTDINLPSASAKGVMDTTLRIDLSETELRFNDKLVTSLKSYQFSQHEVDAQGTVLPLKSVLQSFASDQEKLKHTKVMLYADQTAPYTAVRTVLKTAVDLGLSQLQIAVAQE